MMRRSRCLLLSLLVVLLVGFVVPSVWAGCSEYIGHATLNEASTKNNEDFVEVKLLDGNISSVIYNTWTIGVCSAKGGCSSYNVSSAAVTLPYLVVSGIDQKELDFNKGADILLKDGGGNVIDYLNIGNYSAPASQTSGCSFAFATTVGKSNTHTFARSPDGTGDWAATGPGGSVPNTEEAGNDDATGPDGTPIARIDIANVTINRGDTATFTLSVYDESGNPTTKPYSIQIEYETIDDTAAAGTDYTAGSGTVTIPANAGSATFDVPTLGSGGGGGGGSALDFWVRIINPTGAANPVVILNHFAIGTITDGDTLDHIRIEHSGLGLTCQRSDIVIRACSDADCHSEYLCPVEVTMVPASTNPPYWVDGDSYIFTGNTRVQLRQTTPATLTLGISSPSPTPSNGSVCYVGGSPGTCDITFYESGFIFDVPDLTSCETSAAVSIQAVRADATAQTCVADGGFVGTNKTINFWSSYGNPSSGTEQVSISGTNVATSSPGTGIVLSFDTGATANFTLNYPDAGQLQLDVRYGGVTGSEEEGLVMLGNDSFAVRPIGLCVYSNDANADCVSGNGSCSEFKKVDEVFNLKVKGVCWESSGDTDFCSGNPTTQNFQLNSIPITHNLVAPSSAGASSGNIGVSSIDISAADNGEHIISNQTVSEVGVFTFTATPPNYFGEPLPAATSENIGRFTPDHFITSITNNGVLQDGCSGFTYSGQTFSYVSSNFPEMLITATDSAGNTTVNYRDDFVKLTDPATQISMPAVTADVSHTGALGTPLALTWVPSSHLVRNDDGTLTFTLGADQFAYTREDNALVAPFTSDIQLSFTSIVDSDGIAATGLPSEFSPIGTEIRYGQMQLQNAYGPETLPLTIPVLTEYYDGNGFLLNSLDNCTSFDALHLSLSNFQGNLTSSDTAASGSGILLSGIGNNLNLSAPGVGNEGSVDLTLDLSQATGADMEWLQPGGNNPAAKATFGIFKGNQRLIYMRESIW